MDILVILSSILSILLIFCLFILILDISSSFLDNISFYRQCIIYKQITKEINKMLYDDWKIKELALTTINTNIGGDYSVYVELINHKTRMWTNDKVIVNKKGNIIKTDLLTKMKFYDNVEQQEKKK